MFINFPYNINFYSIGFRRFSTVAYFNSTIRNYLYAIKQIVRKCKRTLITYLFDKGNNIGLSKINTKQFTRIAQYFVSTAVCSHRPDVFFIWTDCVLRPFLIIRIEDRTTLRFYCVVLYTFLKNGTRV